ncbi:MAG: alpha/beta hydrolase family protein [Chitinophagales bacterium]
MRKIRGKIYGKILPGLICFLSINAFAQVSRNLEGRWKGIIHAGSDIRVYFNFHKDSTGQWVISMDSPDQGVMGIPCSNMLSQNDSLSIDVPTAGAKYKGKWVSDSSINGKWIQGLSIPLNLKRNIESVILSRPQTPKPPFPYASEDVEYDNRNKTLHYGATLTTPPGNGPFPAVVMITGSGAQNRDEELLGHKPFAVIADYLSRKGVMVLRVDDRGIGKSSGSFDSSNSSDFARDVNTSVDYLKTIPKVDLKKIGLIGHSEGGMIAPMVASQRNDIDFIILLAGPGEKIIKLMEEQSAALLQSSGINKDEISSYSRFYPIMVHSTIDAKDDAEARQQLTAALEEWKKSTPKNHVLATTGISNDSTQYKFVEGTTQVMRKPWFMYFMQFDPTPYLEGLSCKVLALNGEKDLQVLPDPNLQGIEAALKKSKSKLFEVHKIPGLNHLFQDCKKCTIQEYGQLEETFSPVALDMMGTWINKNVK